MPIWPSNWSHIHKQKSFSPHTAQRSHLVRYSWTGTGWSLSGHFGFNLQPMALTNASQRCCYGNMGLFQFFPSSFGHVADERPEVALEREYRGDAHTTCLLWRRWTSTGSQFSQDRAILDKWKMTQTGTNTKLPLSNNVIYGLTPQSLN